jgi:hypothetical protein
MAAMENDQSRDALSDRKALRDSGLFAVGPPAAYTLRRSMVRADVLAGLRYILSEIAKYIYFLERWYVIDATYVKTPFYQKIAQVNEKGARVWKKVKSAKVFIVRGLKTGIPVAALITDDNVNDQVVFPILFDQMMKAGAIIRGGGFIGDAGFNKAEHFELVHKHGGRAFFGFDSNAQTTNGRCPHHDEQLIFLKTKRDEWDATYNQRELIESTNHAIKTLFKRAFRAKFEISRDNEAFGLLAMYALSRLPEARLLHKIDLPFADDEAIAFIDKALRPKRQPKAPWPKIGRTTKPLPALPAFGVRLWSERT